MKYFVYINNTIIDVISDNMLSLVQLSIYGYVSTTDPKTTYFYVINFVSDTITSQEYNTTYRQILKSGGLVIRYEYLRMMKTKTD